MTTPAASAASQPLGDMTPAEIARYALKAWAIYGDQVHTLHTEYDQWRATHDDCGRPLDSSTLDSEPTTAELESAHQKLARMREDVRNAMGSMKAWLLIAQTAADVARLDSDSPLPDELPGVELAAARAWFKTMTQRAEGGEPLVAGDKAAIRWRIMSPDQRFATQVIVGKMLADFGLES